MQHLRKVFTLLSIFAAPLQAKKYLKSSINCSVTDIKEKQIPFLSHTEGCRSLGITWNRTAENQLYYSIHYQMYFSRSTALRCSVGVSPLKFKNQKEIRWVIDPSFLYTFFSINERHYISLFVAPIIEYGPYEAVIFGLPKRKEWDVRAVLGLDYTFYLNQHLAVAVGMGPCIAFFKNKGASGLLANFLFQYNL